MITSLQLLFLMLIIFNVHGTFNITPPFVLHACITTVRVSLSSKSW
jgi:hypothetical protein